MLQVAPAQLLDVRKTIQLEFYILARGGFHSALTSAGRKTKVGFAPGRPAARGSPPSPCVLRPGRSVCTSRQWRSERRVCWPALTTTATCAAWATSASRRSHRSDLPWALMSRDLDELRLSGAIDQLAVRGHGKRGQRGCPVLCQGTGAKDQRDAAPRAQVLPKALVQNALSTFRFIKASCLKLSQQSVQRGQGCVQQSS